MIDRASKAIHQRYPKSGFVGISRALALGLPGIVAVVLLVPPPADIPAVALAINPTILLSAAAIAGFFAAPKLGLRSSILLGDPIGARQLFCALALGAGLGLGLSGLDCATAAIWQGPNTNLPALCEPAGFTSLMIGFLYGGVTEELIMRWGLLSILALGLSRLMSVQLSLAIAVLTSAALFAIAHLPAVWLATTDPSSALLTRTLLLNAAAGLVFGILYLRSGLEAAMLAHIGFHGAVFVIGSIIGANV